MENKTLREICDTEGVSRRAVQGYEKAGLVSASCKNERGYLLYDTNSQERIRKIKLYQELGFSIKEIKGIVDAPSAVRKIALERQIEKLKEEGKYIEILIHKANELLNNIVK